MSSEPLRMSKVGSRADQTCRDIDGQAKDRDIEQDAQYLLSQHGLADRARHDGDVGGLGGYGNGERKVQKIPVIQLSRIIRDGKRSAFGRRFVELLRVVKGEQRAYKTPRAKHGHGGDTVIELSLSFGFFLGVCLLVFVGG